MRNTFFLALGFLALAFTASAQNDPYTSINQKLANQAQEPSQLWPMDLEGIPVKDEALKLKYTFPFLSEDSELAFNFSQFKKLESSVYDLSKLNAKELIEGFNAGIPSDFKEDFSKIGSEDFCLMYSKAEKNQPKEVYLMVGNRNQAELLHFTYSQDAGTNHQNLKIELNNVLN
ncbi:hypothetical protein SAMN04488104_104633 [Algoriphagus faecimaris]|uniref:Beta-lactamase-inhibitor-like, PepSY-like n=1 Tax=Algoriphagus faecimaris TaxID=686796 RepID=A0A1G6WQH3_9BACT|nr:hypothetical protein [Algoriphagus faecimaris]SDD67903.1 hypothetical protein SAMN04488104_104633 [Algoriphagus faecimaris]